jgi:hypothetical protein
MPWLKAGVRKAGTIKVPGYRFTSRFDEVMDFASLDRATTFCPTRVKGREMFREGVG